MPSMPSTHPNGAVKSNMLTELPTPRFKSIRLVPMFLITGLESAANLIRILPR